MSKRTRNILMLAKQWGKPFDEVTLHSDNETAISPPLNIGQYNPGYVEVSPVRMMNNNCDGILQPIGNIDCETSATEGTSEKTYHTLENVPFVEETVECERMSKTLNKAHPCYMMITQTKYTNNENNESVYSFESSPIEEIDKTRGNIIESPNIDNSPTFYENTQMSEISNKAHICYMMPTQQKYKDNKNNDESVYSLESSSVEEIDKDSDYIAESPDIENPPIEFEQVAFGSSEENFKNGKCPEDRDSQITEEEIQKDKRSKLSVTEHIPNMGQIEKEILPSEESPSTLEQESSVSNAKPETDVMQRTKTTYIERAKTENVDRIVTNFGRIMQENASNVDAISNYRPWTKRNMCPYCMLEVTHFTRHLDRNHSTEGAVREVLCMSKSNKKRKILLDAIRRQGNYVRHNAVDSIRPIRRPRTTEDNPDHNSSDKAYVPCDCCLEFFKRAYIRRHRKQCLKKMGNDNETDNNSSHRENHLSQIQLFTVCSGPYKDFYDSLQLKTEVFPIMRNDDISKAAMNDVLVCSFGESQLKKHKRTQMKNVISNKLREMGRLLIQLRKTCGAKQLFDVLKPEFFDHFVAATKVLSGFDIETKSFRAGSLALHMGTNLKYICDTATKLIIKKSKLLPCENIEQYLKEIKRLKSLIQSNWNTEISSIALKDLNEKNWQKPKLLPLTSDLMVFQKYVTKRANDAFENIKNSIDINKNYRNLAECVLALTLLLNRKRIGEIQFLKLSVYCSRKDNEPSISDCLDSLTESEKFLSKQFMRVVTGGKGSKPVPILFPSNIQNFINSMLDIRDMCVPQTNEYLFANPNTANRWLSGYHVLKKLAKESGVSNQELITSTRLRKQIASIVQVLNINDSEMEQLAKFMGHTKKTHEEYYRLPQDVYQTAKVSKIFLAINNGKTAMYKGKSLDEIELSDYVDSEGSDIEDDLMNSPPSKKKRLAASDTNNSPMDSDDDDAPSSSHVSRLKNKERIEDIDSSAPKKARKVRFTEEQKEKIGTFFTNHIENKKAPKKCEVEGFIEENKPLFNNKCWVKIKTFVYNCYRSK